MVDSLRSHLLVTLELTEIPPTGYISTGEMVTGLAELTGLNYLNIAFAKPTPRLEPKNPHPLIRIVLPALTCFYFGGGSDYLEDFVARIDCPRLNSQLPALNYYCFATFGVL